MAPSSSSILLMLSLVVVLIMALFILPSSSTSRRVLVHRHEHYQTTINKNGFRIDLKHIDSTKNFTKLQLVQRGIKRGQKRLQRLSAMTSVTSSGNDELGSPVHAGSGEYLMSLSIGTPPMPYEAIMDTGSDLIWTQCKPCTDCYTQPTPIFDPKNSSSFSKLTCNNILCKSLSTSTCKHGGCEYLYAYGDYSMTQGVLASETFTFGASISNQEQVSIPQIGFGCGNDNEGSGFTQGAGLVGLGRGPLSLVSQISSGKFSYCLTSIDNTRTSSLLFGSSSDLINKTKISETMTTSLIKNPLQPSFYYLSLEGITVGDTRLPIPKSTFALRRNGSGGLIIDSGTTITYLEQAGFKLVKKAFVSQMGLPVADAGSTGLDLCFKLPSDTSDIEVPSLVFHFKGVDLDLPGNNYMIGDLDAGLICLAMGSSSGMSIFGNVQQQNMLIVHDLDKESLSFVPTKCDQL